MGYYLYKIVNKLISAVEDIPRNRYLYGDRNSDWKKKYEELEKRVKALEEKEN